MIKTKKKKKTIRTAIIILITAFIFFVLFTNIDIFELYNAFLSSKKWLLMVLFIFVVPFFIIKAYKWQIILKAMECNIPFKRALYITIAAFPFLAVTPSNTGDLIKGYYLKDKIPMAKTFGSVITEKVLDLFSLCSFVLVGLFSFYMNRVYLIVTLIFLVGMIFLFLSSQLNIKIPNKRWDKIFQSVVLSMRTMMKKPRIFLILMLYAIFTWIVGLFQVYLFFVALNVQIPFLVVVALMPIAILISQIPLTFGGMGTRDSAIILLFSRYATAPVLLGVGILFSFFRYILPALIGLPFIKKASEMR